MAKYVFLHFSNELLSLSFAVCKTLPFPIGGVSSAQYVNNDGKNVPFYESRVP